MTLNIPNLAIRNMFVDYYDELSDFANVDEARKGFGTAARALPIPKVGFVKPAQLAATVVEVCGSAGCNWFDLAVRAHAALSVVFSSQR